jgi:hypothetical protein
MGWLNYHLYKFKIGGQEYGVSDPDNEFYGLHFKNSGRTKLEQVVTSTGDAFRYEYDFGDMWEHMLVVEDILEYKPNMKYLACLTGERACPPEDCGGPYGYADLLETIADPSHEDYQDMKMWLGKDFNPDRFDIEKVNLKLKSMRI